MNFTNILKSIFIAAFLFSFNYSESLINKKDYSNHMELFIHQDILNNFLSSLRNLVYNLRFFTCNKS